MELIDMPQSELPHIVARADQSMDTVGGDFILIGENFGEEISSIGHFAPTEDELVMFRESRSSTSGNGGSQNKWWRT